MIDELKLVEGMILRCDPSPALTLASLRRLAEHLTKAGLTVPPKLRRGIRVVERAPQREHERLCAAVLHASGAWAPSSYGYHGHLCPAYPKAPRDAQAKLALGMKPTQILRGLTKREAHEAMLMGEMSPAGFVLRRDARTEHALAAHGVLISIGHVGLAVARWIEACILDPERLAALEQEREHRIAGQIIRGKLITRLDEIRPEDLDQGIRSGVTSTFERSARRAYATWSKGAEHDETPLAPVPSWWRPIRCARILLSNAALIREGREMDHCVGLYGPRVKARQCVIVSIRVLAGDILHQSTAEIENGQAVQHRGKGNAEPPELCKRALRVCLKRWGDAE